MKTKIFILITIITAVCYGFYLFWGERIQSDKLECRAKLVREMEGVCKDDGKGYGMGTFNYLLSMHGDGQGYLIILGAYACPNAPQVLVDNKIDFNYQKKGGYYSLQTGETTPEIKKIFRVFTHPDLKIKITPLDQWEYLVSMPFEPPLVCKKE